MCEAVAGHFPLAFLAEGPIPAAGYSGLIFRPCPGSCRWEPDSTHATANRKSLGRIDGRAAVSVERYVRIEFMGSSKQGAVSVTGPDRCQSQVLEIFSIA